MSTITVSFKSKEIDIYKYVCGKSSSPGTYLKDLAIKDYEESKKKNPICKTSNVPNFNFLD